MGNQYDFRQATPMPVDSAKFMSNALGQLNQRVPYQMPVGMHKIGNIDVNNRPVVHNDDGSISTVFSTRAPLGDGKWALIPTIVNGKFLTPSGKKPNEKNPAEMQALEDAATEHFKKSGEHLGIFDSPDAADKFAEITHAWTPTGTGEQVFLPYKADMALGGQ